MKPSYLTAIILLFLYSPIVFAQSEKPVYTKKMIDSLKLHALSDYAIKYPLLRQGFFATDIIGKGPIKAELNGKQIFEGEANVTRIRSNFNVPFLEWGKNKITGTISYQQQHVVTNNITSYSSDITDADRSITKATVGFTATYSRADSLFSHPVFYSVSISGITDELSAIKRVAYTGSINVPVKRNQYTSLSLGLVIIIDPSSVTPVVPIVSYWHKFKASELELFADMPSRIALRKQINKWSWASVGTELGSSFAFFNLSQPLLPQNAIYTTMEFRTGATFEYLLTKKLILGVNGGVLTTASSRMYDSNKKNSDYFLKTQNGTVPYISFSISFLPFLKSLK